MICGAFWNLSRLSKHMSKIIWELPLKTVSESNCSEHWTKKSKRHKQQQFFIRSLFSHEAQEIPIPCIVKMIRIGPRFLDKDDNLPMSFKWIKDEISECLFPDKRGSYLNKQGKIRFIKGRADDSPLVKWEYDQEKSKIQGIRIEISSLSLVEPLNIGHV